MAKPRDPRIQLDMARWEAEVLLDLLREKSYHSGRDGKGIARLIVALSYELGVLANEAAQEEPNNA